MVGVDSVEGRVWADVSAKILTNFRGFFDGDNLFFPGIDEAGLTPYVGEFIVVAIGTTITMIDDCDVG